MKRRIAALSAVFVTVTGAALAFFVGPSIFEGEGSATTGKASLAVLPLSASFKGNIVPGNTEAVSFTLNNTTGRVLTLGSKLETTITDSNEGACPASTFTLTATGGTVAAALLAGSYTGAASVPTGESDLITDAAEGTSAPVELHFAETGKPQTGCESVTVVIHAKIAASG